MSELKFIKLDDDWQVVICEQSFNSYPKGRWINHSTCKHYHSHTKEPHHGRQFNTKIEKRLFYCHCCGDRMPTDTIDKLKFLYGL